MYGNRDSYMDMGQHSYPKPNIPVQPMPHLSLQPPLGPPSYYDPQNQIEYPTDMQYQQPRYYPPMPGMGPQNLQINQWRDPNMQGKIPVLHPSQTQSYQQQAPINIVQRISMLIKSQLPALKHIMRYQQIPRQKKSYHRSKSRSRSRSRQRERASKRSDSKQPMQWLCRKCSFSNFDWRDRCKKCNQLHQPKGFVPGPEDWKCSKCGNINYARRNECNRCKTPK